MDPRDLVDGLITRPYAIERSHRILADGAGTREGPTIGSLGQRLTITFLTQNRSSLSARLINSIANHIPHFAGRVLIADNGSSAPEIAALRSAAERLPCEWSIVELGENYGVAGGRNRALNLVQTEWAMCLDNDMYFVGDPLSRIQDDLAELGCHFLNLPLLEPEGRKLFAMGGHLYLGRMGNRVHIGAGSVMKQGGELPEAYSPFLSSFLFGGACVLRVSSFRQLGEYDEGMFVGFEDLDFSIRLFKAGMKVGSSSVLALVHDHPPPTTAIDRVSEDSRFTSSLLRRSAEHMEAKHGFAVWSDVVEEWIADRRHHLQLDDEHTSVDTLAIPTTLTAEIEQSQPPTSARPKIALVVDVFGWAFHNIARQIERNLSDRFDFVTISMQAINENVGTLLLMTADCDLVHFFWREHLTLIGSPWLRDYAERLGFDLAVFERDYVYGRKITTSVYDHLLIDSDSTYHRTSLFSDLISGYTVSSEKLFHVYSTIPGYPNPNAIVEDGVDLSLFQPRGLERLLDIGSRPAVIGWAGNSLWAAESGQDHKGFRSILLPALELLRSAGVSVVGKFADRQISHIPHIQMPDYYSGIDIFVCTSEIEGTPNPVLEAMACGVPVVSTDVGIVPQVFGQEQRRWIIGERSADAFAKAIGEALCEPSILPILSNENLQSIKEWDWSQRVEGFASFFESVLSDRDSSQ